MILGSFSPALTDPFTIALKKVREFNVAGDVSFHEISGRGFEGGYFLNARLPYNVNNCYYSDEDRDILVLLSGRIYNRTELKNLLSISADISEPALIAELFLNKGPGFVRNLNGDFAIFILQPSGKQSYLYRDHLGICPVAYTIDYHTICFSSDIIGLCRAIAGERNISSEFLLSYFKYTDQRDTPCHEVTKLLPGHFIHFSDTGSEIIKYWEPEKIKIDRELSYESMISDLRTTVRDAVKIRCDNRFVAGAHVTGGLDSGIVSTLARKEYKGQEIFRGFSWSPGSYKPQNVRYDERTLILKTCENADILPCFSEMERDIFRKNVSGYYNNMGYFSEDHASDQAAGFQTNLIFSGWGGDEFISTGDRGIESDLLAGLRFKIFFKRNPVKSPWKFLKYLMLYVILPSMGILDPATARSFREEARYIKKPYKRSNRRALKDYYFHTSRRSVHLGVLHFYHLQERCESWAVNGFRKGVEYRYPLLDRRIIEYMLKVPSELLCRTDYFRPLLRVIGEGILPDDVRLQNDKSDPVCWEYLDILFRESAVDFMEEVRSWMDNPDLKFIDFDLLSEDISRFNSGPFDSGRKQLFRALVYIKAINDFTIEYHRG